MRAASKGKGRFLVASIAWNKPKAEETEGKRVDQSMLAECRERRQWSSKGQRQRQRQEAEAPAAVRSVCNAPRAMMHRGQERVAAWFIIFMEGEWQQAVCGQGWAVSIGASVSVVSSYV